MKRLVLGAMPLLMAIAGIVAEFRSLAPTESVHFAPASEDTLELSSQGRYTSQRYRGGTGRREILS